MAVSNRKKCSRPTSSPKRATSPMANFILRNRSIQMKINSLVVDINHPHKQHLQKNQTSKFKLQMDIT